MAFPTPNTTFRLWVAGSNPITDPEDAAGVLQQLKPLIPVNEFQQTLYENALIYRFAILDDTEIDTLMLPGALIGIPAKEALAVYTVLAFHAVNQPVSTLKYWYVVCKLNGYFV